MREDYTSSEFVKLYDQSSNDNWRYYVIPAIKRWLSKASGRDSILDLGCGTGELKKLSDSLEFKKYVGIDNSQAMLEKAKKLHPDSIFLKTKAQDFFPTLPEELRTFDAIVSIMMLPALTTRADLHSALKNCEKALKKDGSLLLCVAHPCFDPYMLSALFNLKGIQSSFSGYYESGSEYSVSRDIKTGEFVTFETTPNLVFKDFHWTISDYTEAITTAGLQITAIDECQPSLDCTDEKLVNNLPTNFLFICTK